ncbi:MAG: hypothetical protein F6J93_34845 [Oscillatoria sp. SIO1A7]|nr:hypothetical protein [Oscillatoria sp. SIO1A7]
MIFIADGAGGSSESAAIAIVMRSQPIPLSWETLQTIRKTTAEAIAVKDLRAIALRASLKVI